MSPLRAAVCCSSLLIGCSVASAASVAPVEAAPQKSREELAKQTQALITSVTARLSERDLAAAVASEHVALLDQRADKLRTRCQRMTPRELAELQPHLSWLEQVHTTTTLAIGVLRNDSRDFEEDKAEVLLWMKVFVKEIDALERRVDRVAPLNVLLTQRSRK